MQMQRVYNIRQTGTEKQAFMDGLHILEISFQEVLPFCLVRPT